MFENNKLINKVNFVEIIIIFFSILLKYLIIHKVSNLVLYPYLCGLLFLAFCVVFRKKVKHSELMKIMFLFLISVYFVVYYKDVNFLISFLLAIVCLDKENKSFIKIFMVSSIVLYILNIVFNFMGILPSNNLVRYTESGVITRYDLGFGHPNEVFLFWLPILFSAYYLYGENKAFYLITTLISLILFYLSNCRTGIVCALLLLVLGWIQSFTGKLKNFRFISIIFLMYSFISILIASKFGSNINDPINVALSYRPYYWNLYLDNNMLFSIFGHNYNTVWYIDNFYLYLLIDLGLTGFLLYFILYFLSLKRLHFDYKLVLIIFVFLLYGLFESNVIIGSIQFAFAIQLKILIEDKKTRIILKNIEE